MASRPSGSAPIVLLLLSTLTIAGALAYQAQQAARSHRETAENVLRDYATFASWELARVVRRELNDTLGAQLARLSTSCRDGAALPDLKQLLRVQDG